MQDWIRRHNRDILVKIETYRDGEGYMAMFGSRGRWELTKMPDQLIPDWLEFNNKYLELSNTVGIDDDLRNGYFCTFLANKYPIIQSNYISSSCDTSFSKPLEVLHTAVKPYADVMVGVFKYNAVRIFRNYSWSAQSKNTSFGRSFARAVHMFCELGVSVSYNNRTIEVPDLSTFQMKKGMSNSEVLKKSIIDSIDNISSFLNVMTSKKGQEYISEFIDNGGVIRRNMKRSSFNKLITFMNNIKVSDANEYYKLKDHTDEYIPEKEIEDIDLLISNMSNLKLSRLEHFSVTVNGVIFKLINVSGTIIGRKRYSNAYRIQVMTPFLGYSIENIIDGTEDIYDNRNQCYKFYRSLRILGAHKLFMDKLKMEILSRI